jgi:putative ABC transport system permease protein
MRPGLAGPVARAVRGGLARRRVQTTVIALVLLVSVGASVLALALIADSSSPFDHAFAAQRGAHVTATVSPARATPAQLAATRRLAGVTAAAGPFPEVTITPRLAMPGGTITAPPMTLAGRASPGGAVDQLSLQSGHWPRRPGQVVLASDPSPGSHVGIPLGTRLTVTSAPGRPVLTVVGLASSVTSSAAGWVLPAQVASLRAADAEPAAQLLYRFASAGSAAAVRHDVAAVTAALPRGAITGTESYLTVRTQQSSSIAPFVPFLVAFGVIGIAMSVLIVANVVSGAVVSGYRRIGVLKSIGFTPGQVVAAYAGQAALPAAAGCLGGVLLGNLLAAPLLHQAAEAYGVATLGVPSWVDVTVPATMLGLVAVAVVLPALRGGRLSAVQAIAAGRAPRTGRGYAAHRLLGRLPLPRPVTIGLAGPFARPARTAITLAAVLLGATAVTFAVGLSGSLNRVVAALSHDQTEPVQVLLPGPGTGPGPVFQRAGPGQHAAPGRPGRRGGPGGAGGGRGGRGQGSPPPPGRRPTPAAAQRAVTAALRAQPGTLHYVAEAERLASVPGLTGLVRVTAFRGDARWIGYQLISGHWYAGPGQVVVPTGFLTATGTSVGDTVAVTFGKRQIRVRIVGEVFDTRNQGIAMFTGWRTVARADPALTQGQYDVGLRPGTSASAYAQRVGRALGSAYFVTVNDSSSDELALMLSLVATLTLLLAVVAGLGVLNTVVLHTRERVHDLGVFKAVGMTPRQAIAMVVCWVAGTGLVAGLIAVPAGMALHRYVLPAMAASAGVGLPGSILRVYGPWELAGLALAGLAIAVGGALLPAGWAAGTRTAVALRAE